MCGKVVGTRRYMVEGTIMTLGLECAKYGTPMDATAPAGSQGAIAHNLQRRETRMTSRNVYDQQEAVTLVDNFGPKIHKAREAKGLSHEQLGNKVSARVPELKHIESGKLRPSDDLTKKLEKELGITLLERVEAAPTGLGGSPKSAAGFTLGDMLRDAMDKKKGK